jgi:site-specific recombinase XerD
MGEIAQQRCAGIPIQPILALGWDRSLMIIPLIADYNSTPALPAPAEDPWARIKSLVLDSLGSAHSRRAYGHAWDDFQSWCASQDRPEFHKATVQRYRVWLEERGLSPASINVRLSALRKLAAEAADNRLLAPDLAAAIGRVQGAKRQGRRTGNWLTRSQAEGMLSLPDRATHRGKRDLVLLGLLLGCGLRREELARLTVDGIQQRDARWVLIDLVGKGRRVRTVPMPAWAKLAVDRWVEAAGIPAGGRLLRAVNKGDRVTGAGMTAQSVFAVVAGYGRRLGLEIAPHDLRRTFAKLAHQGHAALEQIRISLGHASLQTTERYLGIEQDLSDAPCDRLGLKV